jgi:transposase
MVGDQALHAAGAAAGRPRTTRLRAVVYAIFYLANGGFQWRPLPKEFLLESGDLDRKPILPRP